MKIINDISENALPKLLPQISGDVCFWLDGHYSDGATFEGPNETPLHHELDCIGKNLRNFEKVAVLIDDIRYCGKVNMYGAYPSLDELVSFAVESKLNWHIEHDIFVATTRT